MKTPYFLIHKNKIDKLVNDIQTSLRKNWKKGIIGYSFKTNNLPWIIEYMKSKGMWAEVVSSDEFQLARCLDFPYENIIFNGPVKGHDEFVEAVTKGSIVNIDSKRELKWLLECNEIKALIGLRVNFDLEKYCPTETQCGSEDGRFGFSYETGELKAAIDFLNKHGISLSGLHLHCSSKTRSKKIYMAISQITVEIVRKYGLNPSYIDVGGGFSGGVPGKPTFYDYFESIKKILDQEPRLSNTNLIVEPGMAVIGAAVDYVTSVIDIKDTVNNRFVVTDGSRIHIDPLMRKHSYTFEIKKHGIVNLLCGPKECATLDSVEKQTICGFTCMENDRLFQMEDEKPLTVGEQIIFQKVGAYTIGLTPLFIQFYPAVYVKEKGNINCVRKKWTAKRFVDDLD